LWDLLAAAADRMGAALEVARVGARCGVEFERTDLVREGVREGAGDEGFLEDALDRLVADGILRQTAAGGYRFRQPLLQRWLSAP
jgi:hypothetical protein